jgi:predicted ABC-type transport system involved in lysophospholipase L1 biosynthesis ATPase subunit
VLITHDDEVAHRADRTVVVTDGRLRDSVPGHRR